MDVTASAINTVRTRLPGIECRLNEPMKNHTSFKIGGLVRAMLRPSGAKELCSLCGILSEFGIKPLVMGNGTNLLVRDGELDLIVIKTSALCEISLTGGEEITAGSGVSLSRLAVFSCEKGFTGLEFAHGIPGTLGGAVSMNAGAYGGEIKDVVIRTDAVDSCGAPFSAIGNEQGFVYRKSRFSGTDDIVLSSVIRLRRGEPESIRARMDELSERRRESQPLNLPSAGSAFKRPKNGYAAALIEQAGLKGYAVGGAQVSKKHAGFIVNRGGASFSDVLAVIEHVKDMVSREFGIELEPEIKIIRGGN